MKEPLPPALHRGSLRARAAAAVLACFWASPSDASEPLADYAWTHRPLILFAPTKDHPEAAQMSHRVEEDRAGLRDRDMLLVTVYGDATHVDGAPAPELSASGLRERYGAEAGRFTLILVGKDTGVKLQAAEATRLADIFALIDRMPMRRREMRERASD